MENIQFHIGTNSTSQWNQSNFKMEQMQFNNGNNQILI